jgi:polar amino acid transport system substrate-binding protein
LPLLFVAAVAAAAFAGCSPDATVTDAPPAEPATTEAAEPTPDPAQTTDLGGRELLIGTDATYRPFEYVEDGEIVGIDPDLMAAVCEIANCTPRFVSTSWDGIFGALAAGEFDALMSAITILPEREAESGATFTVPYFSVGQVILLRADSELASTEDLAGHLVAVQIGTTGDLAATDELAVEEANMSRHETIVLAIQALLNGDADAVVLDNPTAEVAVAQNPGDLKLMGPPFTTEDYGILVPNSTPEVLAALNAAISQLQATGGIDGIVQRWYAPAE